MNPNSRGSKVYIGVLAAASLGLLILLLLDYHPTNDPVHWLLLLVFFILTILSNRYFIHLGSSIHLQVNAIPIFASVLLFPPFEVAVITTIAAYLVPHRREATWSERIFNPLHVLLYAGFGGWILAQYTGTPWRPEGLNSWIGILLAFASLYLGNILLYTGMVAVQFRGSFLKQITSTLRSQSIESFVMLALGWIAELVVVAYPWALLLLVVPFILLFIILNQAYRTEADLRMRQAELESITSVSAALRTSTSRAEIIEVVLRKVTEQLEAEGGIIALIEPPQEGLQVKQAVGTWKNLAGKSLALQPPSGRATGPLTKPTFQGLLSEAIWKDTFALAGIPDQPSLYTTLRVKETAIGMIAVSRMRLFNDEDIRLLSAAADIAANAIYRTTLSERNQLYMQQLNRVSRLGETLSETLSETQIVSRLAQSLQALFEQLDVCLIYLLDPDARLLEPSFAIIAGHVTSIDQAAPFPADESLPLIPQILQTRRPYQTTEDDQLAALWDRMVPNHPPAHPYQSAMVVPLIAREEAIGFMWLASSQQNLFQSSDEELALLAGNIAAVTLQNARLFEGLHHKNIELTSAYDSTLVSLAKALELRDRETGDHCERVTSLTLQLAAAMKVPDDQLPHIRRGAYLHDIGKIGIPDAILLKAGPLTDEEWQIMYRHPELAYHLIEDIPYLKPAVDIPYYHHEKWDGTGYPCQLKGDQIPLAARIFSVVDVWDALSSERPYRPSWSKSRIMDYLIMQKGRHFDPVVVDTFLSMLKLR